MTRKTCRQYIGWDVCGAPATARAEFSNGGHRPVCDEHARECKAWGSTIVPLTAARALIAE